MSITLMRLALNLAGDPLFKPLKEESMSQALVGSALQRNADAIRGLAQTTFHGISFKGEVKRRVLDPGDLRLAGHAASRSRRRDWVVP